ncbi:MAG: galactose mutarotase [Clostridia bacterium]|nr:galactose mutarotase [Clostridia bacterium]
MAIRKLPFGQLKDGTQLDLYVMTNKQGASVSISNYGGLITSIMVPDKHGALGDVTLGCADAEHYQPNNGYLGAVIGRVGNRIAGGECTVAGQKLRLAKNDGGKNHLHGGDVGFDKYVWQLTPVEGEGEDQLVLRHVSPDGDEGYPGELRVTLTYGWNDQCELSLHYEAAANKDTLCNLTQHAYFNLAGQDSGNILDHVIKINADTITAVANSECIPTGEFMDVTGTPLDLREGKRIGDGLALENDDTQMTYGVGYDHNFVAGGTGLREIVVVTEPTSGRTMRVFTDMEAVQFYSGNHLNGKMVSPSGKPYMKRAGFCLETQYHPDSINHPNFPDCVLHVGEKYDFTTIYKFEA